ncbi:uncharacterized protein LOC117668056 isoform X2 [Pantherophis guttatus]|uniref:Uncharacterized protein LOC117668056 isoform X2 n=1 Tax=Pantherophis guttatus TaxID=94885 RepID=A0A6P9CED0_PANGU|nr:uncharacterized protein LOC117668056 isoform X2 [Pantherophis guttatus]
MRVGRKSSGDDLDLVYLPWQPAAGESFPSSSLQLSKAVPCLYFSLYPPMKPFLFLIPAAVAALTLAGTTVWPLQEIVNAGGEIQIPCDRKNVQLIWYWIPRYPICAGLKMGRIEIYRVISNEMHINENLERFQGMMLEKNNGKSVLTVPLQHMNDSGTFYCFDGRSNSSFISVVVKSDNRHGMTVSPPEKSQRSKRLVKLTCNLCDDNMKGQIHGSSTIAWTINGQESSKHIFKPLRTAILVEDSPPNYGLWKCSNSRCPTQSDGYCFEDEVRISERTEMEEMFWSTPAPFYKEKKFMIQVIGGCVIGIFVLLWMGVTIFVLREKLPSRRTSPSKIAKEPKSQVIQNSVGIEKPLKNQEKDVEMNEGGEGIQYSVLQFKEPEQCQSQKKEGTPAIIYAEML